MLGAAEIPWTTQAGYPVLAALQLLPLALLVPVYLFRRDTLVLWTGILGAAVELLLAADLYRRFDPGEAGFQLAERVDLVPPLAYRVGVDGMGVIFVLLTALLTVFVVLYGGTRGRGASRGFLASTFAIESALMGMLTTLDLLWFTTLSALQLVLVGYVLWSWATSPGRDLMLIRYLQFMAAGVALLMAGTLMLGWAHADATGGRWSFALADLATLRPPPTFQSVVFLLLFYGIAIRIPVFPLHGWLPLTTEHGQIARGPVFLLGIKTGVFGLLRFVLPILPDAVLRWQHVVVALALAGIFYAALLALMQDNLRRLLAYAVVSHTGLLVIGLFSLSHAGFQGVIILSVDFGLAMAVLLFMTGFLQRRTRTALLPRLGGLFERLPLIGIAFLVGSLSILQMPGTPGFDAAHLMLEAAMDQFGALLTIAAALGNVAAAAFLLWAFQRAFLAPRPNTMPAGQIARATRLERLIAVGLITVLLGAGFYSEPMLRLTERSLLDTASLFNPAPGAGLHAEPAP